MVQHPKVRNLSGSQFDYIVSRIIDLTGKRDGEVIEMMKILESETVYVACVELGMSEDEAKNNAGRARKIYKNSSDKHKYNRL